MNDNEEKTTPDHEKEVNDNETDQNGKDDSDEELDELSNRVLDAFRENDSDDFDEEEEDESDDDDADENEEDESDKDKDEKSKEESEDSQDNEKKYLIGDEQYSEQSAAELAKAYGKTLDEWDDVVNDHRNAANWQKSNTEKAEQLKAKEKEIEAREAEFKESRIEAVEADTGKDFDEKIAAIEKELAEKKEATDFEEGEEIAEYNEFMFDRKNEIVDLKRERQAAIDTEKAKIEGEQKKQEAHNAKLITDLCKTYPEEFPVDDLTNELETLSATYKPGEDIDFEKFPTHKKLAELTEYANGKGILIPSVAMKHRQLEEAEKTIEQRIKEAEDAGYKKAIAEIKKDRANFDHEDEDKPKDQVKKKQKPSGISDIALEKSAARLLKNARV